MITEFAKYDDNEPQIGDWVVARIDDERRNNGEEWAKKVESTVGKVVSTPDPDFDYDYNNKKDYFKGWKLKHDWNNQGIAIIFKREIVFFNKDKEIAEAYIQTQKYNL